VDTEASTPALAMLISPESSPAVLGSRESLPSLEEMLGLPNREVTPVEEEDLGLAGLFRLLPDPGDHNHLRLVIVDPLDRYLKSVGTSSPILTR